MFGNPSQGPRLIPYQSPYTSADKLPNGRPCFRVTQPYTSSHLALDIGNFNCGDNIIAMEAGRTAHLSDPNGALGIRITHSNGYKSEYWHLSRRAVSSGVWVSRGQVIGYNGSTGQSTGCHTHLVVITSAGRIVDPWPLLDQNSQKRLVIVPAGVNIRTAPRLGTTIYPYTRRPVSLSLAGFIRGGLHGIQPYPYDWAKVWLNGGYRYVARPLIRYA